MLNSRRYFSQPICCFINTQSNETPKADTTNIKTNHNRREREGVLSIKRTTIQRDLRLEEAHSAIELSYTSESKATTTAEMQGISSASWKITRTIV